MHDVTEEGRCTGTVKWFNADKGFGFIKRDDQEGDVFLHYRQLPRSTTNAENRRQVDEGRRVAFGIKPGDRGPIAVHVTLLDLPALIDEPQRGQVQGTDQDFPANAGNQ